MKQLRVLFFDIETGPLLAYAWQAKTEYIPHDRFLHDSFLLSWAARWRGSNKTMSMALTPEQAVAQDDEDLVVGLADLMREADIIVAHNIVGFDVPMFNNRLLLMGLEPTGRTEMIDTLTVARKNFRLASSKLDYLAKMLGFGTKIKTDFELWDRAYRGDDVALRKMERYNRKDAVLLEQVFEKMLPYVSGLPRLVEATRPDEWACPRCGGTDLMKRGWKRTKASTFQQWKCLDPECGHISRERRGEPNRFALVPL